jgi:hypothetical protein
MPGTRIQSTRTPVVIDNVGKYEILTTCVLPGSLPDTGIFLLSIVDVTGPKSDLLVRVIELGDTTVYQNNRDQAVAAGDTQWRSAEVRLVYDDIETANAAQKELGQRINNLVVNFDTVNNEFTVTNKIIIYPVTVDTTTQTEAKNEYVVARDAATAAEEARDAHVLECTEIENEVNLITVRLTDAASDLAILSAAQSSLLITNGAYPLRTINFSIYATNISNVNTTSSATQSQKNSITAHVTGIQTEATVMTGLNSTLSTAITGPSNSTATLLGILQSRVTTLTADKSAKQTELYQCNIALTKSQAALTSAREAEDAALAAAREVCPDFNPTTV